MSVNIRCLVTISHLKVGHFLESRGRDAILPTQRIPRVRDVSLWSPERYHAHKCILILSELCPNFGKLEGTHSRLYRSHFSTNYPLQKALDEIYRIYIPLHFCQIPKII